MPDLSLDSDITMQNVRGLTRLSPDRPVFLIVAADHSNDLEEAWGPRNRQVAWGSKTRLVMAAYRRVARGMDLGIAEMSARLGKWKAKADCPAGLRDRLNVLGW